MNWTILLILAGLLAFRLIFLRRPHRHSVAVPALAGILVIALLGGLTVRRHVRSANQAGVPAVEAPSFHPDRGATPTAHVPARVSRSQPTGTTNDRTGNEGDSSGESVRIEETEHGNMLVMPLSASVLDEYLGPDGRDALQRLRGAVAPNMRQVYALVPIPGPVGDAVPGLHALATTIAQIARQSKASEVSSAGTPATNMTPPGAPPAEAPNVRLAEAEATGPVLNDLAVPAKRPDWIDKPGADRVVVRTEPVDANQPLEAVLESAVADALLETSRNVVDSRSELAGVTIPARRLKMTPAAVQQCVLKEHVEHVEIETRDGSVHMHYAFALVDFPESVKLQAVRSLQESLQHQRTWSVAAVAVGLAAMVMLFAAILQLAISKTRLVRFGGTALLAVILLPGLFLTGELLRRVSHSENVPLPDLLQIPDALITASDS